MAIEIVVQRICDACQGSGTKDKQACEACRGAGKILGTISTEELVELLKQSD